MTVVNHAREERPSLPQLGKHNLRSGETLRVLLKTLDAEEFGTDGFFKIRYDRAGWLSCIDHMSRDESPLLAHVRDTRPSEETDSMVEIPSLEGSRVQL